MFTMEQAPWVEYLEIDEETLERRLREDTPDEIRALYEQHLAESQPADGEMQAK